MSDSPATWLRELGAIRPPAATGTTSLVIGTFCDGYYPILYERTRDMEWWWLFGIPVPPLERHQVERIVGHLSMGAI